MSNKFTPSILAKANFAFVTDMYNNLINLNNDNCNYLDLCAHLPPKPTGSPYLENWTLGDFSYCYMTEGALAPPCGVNIPSKSTQPITFSSFSTSNDQTMQTPAWLNAMDQIIIEYGTALSNGLLSSEQESFYYSLLTFYTALQKGFSATVTPPPTGKINLASDGNSIQCEDSTDSTPLPGLKTLIYNLITSTTSPLLFPSNIV